MCPKGKLYKEKKTTNVINGSHYYNKEMIAEFLITVSVSSGSFKLEQTGEQVRVITSLLPTLEPQEERWTVAGIRLLLSQGSREINLVVQWVKNPPNNAGDIRDA